MLEMAAAAGDIDLFYLDESGCYQWSPVGHSYYFRGEQKRQEQTQKRGRRLSILGLWQPFVTLIYGLVFGALKSENYIALMDVQAEAAQQAGRPRVMVQDNGSIHTSQVMQQIRGEMFESESELAYRVVLGLEQQGEKQGHTTQYVAVKTT